MEKVTTEKILETLKDWISSKTPISPEIFIDAASKLNVLAGDDEAILAEKEFQLAQIRQHLATQGERTMASINAEIKANPLSKEIQLLKAKIGRIDEFIRIAKLQSRLITEAIQRQ